MQERTRAQNLLDPTSRLAAAVLTPEACCPECNSEQHPTGELANLGSLCDRHFSEWWS